MPKAKILIVEDEQIIAMSLEDSLLYAGYEVCDIAGSGETALEAIATYQPDLVLMDIMLAGPLDGIETAARVRQDYPIPIVFLTALNDEPTLERAKITEPFGYLIKPCDDRDLISTIEVALARFRSETAIQCALLKEKELRELKSHFLAILSHEFRNPLNTILMSQEMLSKYGRDLDPEKYQSHCDRISAAVWEMNELIDEVLTLGETEATGFQFQPAPMDISEFCQILVEEFQSKLANHHTLIFNFGSEISQNLELVLLDAKLLRHTLANLLSNAIKYSPKGGKITFTVTWTEQELCFQVQDQGIGIPPEAQAKLFQPFHRAQNVEGIPGTGLGLAIAKQCVDLHQGTVSIFSEVGQGSTITIKLPRQVASPEQLLSQFQRFQFVQD